MAGSTGLVGSQLVARAREAGHEVVGLARTKGYDVTAPGLERVLAGAEAVVDVLQAPGPGEAEAAAFFTAAAEALGRAAHRVGVRRTVLLSILGADRAAGPDADPAPGSTDGYYRAKHRHEEVTRAFAPEPHVVRSAQFHNFVGQAVGRAGDDCVAQIADLPIQPVDVSVAVDLLLALATGERHDALIEVAGPRRERLVDLAREFAAYYFDDLEVEAVTPSPSLAAGRLLPGDRAVLGGPTFHDWLHGHPRG